jgi:hypothetical protein
MQVTWARDQKELEFNRPSTWFCLGLRGEAKSSFLEHVAMQYLAQDCVVFDLWASRDGENLAWLRSPYAKDKKILLLKGENVDVKGSFPVRTVDALTLHDVESNDIIISASPLHLNIDQEFFDGAKITDLLYTRIKPKKCVFLLIREAANLYYSRIKVSESQVAAKANMIYMVREARHVGLALGLDSIRYYAIDIDIRNLSDYVILKSQGIQGLAPDLHWLYSYFNPYAFMKMPKQAFFIVCGGGALGLGYFPYHKWHKEEREDIVSAVGLKVDYGEPLREALDKGTFKTVSDKEHAEILELRASLLSIDKIAEQKGRSPKTILFHIDSHNGAIERSSFCPACKRVRSPQFNQIVKPHLKSITKTTEVLPTETVVSQQD